MSSTCPLVVLWRTVPPDLVGDGVPEVWIPGGLVLALLPGGPGVGWSTHGGTVRRDLKVQNASKHKNK